MVQNDSTKNSIAEKKIVMKIAKHFSGSYYIDDTNKDTKIFSSEKFIRIYKECQDQEVQTDKKSTKLFNISSNFKYKYEPLKFIDEFCTNRENIRYIMLFVDNDITLSLLEERIENKKKEKPIYMKGSEFNCDVENRKYYVKVLGELKIHINEGEFIIMSDFENIYGILYDLFNQRFSITDSQVNFCQINYENIKERIQISDKFSCILIKREKDLLTDQDKIEKILPSPLLNRFEKHIVSLNNFYDEKYTKCINEIKNKFEEMLTNENYFNKITDSKETWKKRGNQYIFCFHDGNLIEYVFLKLDEDIQKKISNAKSSHFKDYKKFYAEIIKYFTTRMMILLTEHVNEKKINIDLIRYFEFCFAKNQKKESFDNFINSLQKDKNFIFITNSNKILQTDYQPDKQNSKETIYDKKIKVLQTKEIENKGYIFLDEELNNTKNEPQLIIFQFEDEQQFHHFEYIMKKVQDLLQNTKYEIRFGFLIHQSNKRQNKKNEKEIFIDVKRYEKQFEISFMETLEKNYSSSTERDHYYYFMDSLLLMNFDFDQSYQSSIHSLLSENKFKEINKEHLKKDKMEQVEFEKEYEKEIKLFKFFEELSKNLKNTNREKEKLENELKMFSKQIFTKAWMVDFKKIYFSIKYEKFEIELNNIFKILNRFSSIKSFFKFFDYKQDDENKNKIKDWIKQQVKEFSEFDPSSTYKIYQNLEIPFIVFYFEKIKNEVKNNKSNLKIIENQYYENKDLEIFNNLIINNNNNYFENNQNSNMKKIIKIFEEHDFLNVIKDLNCYLFENSKTEQSSEDKNFINSIKNGISFFFEIILNKFENRNKEELVLEIIKWIFLRIEIENEFFKNLCSILNFIEESDYLNPIFQNIFDQIEVESFRNLIQDELKSFNYNNEGKSSYKVFVSNQFMRYIMIFSVTFYDEFLFEASKMKNFILKNLINKNLKIFQKIVAKYSLEDFDENNLYLFLFIKLKENSDIQIPKYIKKNINSQSGLKFNPKMSNIKRSIKTSKIYEENPNEKEDKLKQKFFKSFEKEDKINKLYFKFKDIFIRLDLLSIFSQFNKIEENKEILNEIIRMKKKIATHENIYYNILRYFLKFSNEPKKNTKNSKEKDPESNNEMKKIIIQMYKNIFEKKTIESNQDQEKNIKNIKNNLYIICYNYFLLNKQKTQKQFNKLLEILFYCIIEIMFEYEDKISIDNIYRIKLAFVHIFKENTQNMSFLISIFVRRFLDSVVKNEEIEMKNKSELTYLKNLDEFNLFEKLSKNKYRLFIKNENDSKINKNIENYSIKSRIKNKNRKIIIINWFLNFLDNKFEIQFNDKISNLFVQKIKYQINFDVIEDNSMNKIVNNLKNLVKEYIKILLKEEKNNKELKEYFENKKNILEKYKNKEGIKISRLNNNERKMLFCNEESLHRYLEKMNVVLKIRNLIKMIYHKKDIYKNKNIFTKLSEWFKQEKSEEEQKIKETIRLYLLYCLNSDYNIFIRNSGEINKIVPEIIEETKKNFVQILDLEYLKNIKEYQKKLDEKNFEQNTFLDNIEKNNNSFLLVIIIFNNFLRTEDKNKNKNFESFISQLSKNKDDLKFSNYLKQINKGFDNVGHLNLFSKKNKNKDKNIDFDFQIVVILIFGWILCSKKQNHILNPLLTDLSKENPNTSNYRLNILPNINDFNKYIYKCQDCKEIFVYDNKPNENLSCNNVRCKDDNNNSYLHKISVEEYKNDKTDNSTYIVHEIIEDNRDLFIPEVKSKKNYCFWHLVLHSFFYFFIESKIYKSDFLRKILEKLIKNGPQKIKKMKVEEYLKAHIKKDIEYLQRDFDKDFVTLLPTLLQKIVSQQLDFKKTEIEIEKFFSSKEIDFHKKNEKESEKIIGSINKIVKPKEFKDLVKKTQSIKNLKKENDYDEFLYNHLRLMPKNIYFEIYHNLQNSQKFNNKFQKLRKIFEFKDLLTGKLNKTIIDLREFINTINSIFNEKISLKHLNPDEKECILDKCFKKDLKKNSENDTDEEIKDFFDEILKDLNSQKDMKKLNEQYSKLNEIIENSVEIYKKYKNSDIIQSNKKEFEENNYYDELENYNKNSDQEYFELKMSKFFYIDDKTFSSYQKILSKCNFLKNLMKFLIRIYNQFCISEKSSVNLTEINEKDMVKVNENEFFSILDTHSYQKTESNIQMEYEINFERIEETLLKRFFNQKRKIQEELNPDDTLRVKLISNISNQIFIKFWKKIQFSMYNIEREANLEKIKTQLKNGFENNYQNNINLKHDLIKLIKRINNSIKQNNFGKIKLREIPNQNLIKNLKSIKDNENFLDLCIEDLVEVYEFIEIQDYNHNIFMKPESKKNSSKKKQIFKSISNSDDDDDDYDDENEDFDDQNSSNKFSVKYKDFFDPDMSEENKKFFIENLLKNLKIFILRFIMKDQVNFKKKQNLSQIFKNSDPPIIVKTHLQNCVNMSEEFKIKIRDLFKILEEKLTFINNMQDLNEFIAFLEKQQCKKTFSRLI